MIQKEQFANGIEFLFMAFLSNGNLCNCDISNFHERRFPTF